jgi:broad specificity polyphosphatase/5'/3'-nucleotidase SurE
MHGVLISNCDGVKTPELCSLIKELFKIGKVYVIVPKTQM